MLWFVLAAPSQNILYKGNQSFDCMASDEEIFEDSFENVGFKEELKIRVKEYCAYSPILRSLLVRNLFGRYRSSLMGFAWHFISPLILIIVYYLVFNQVSASSLPDFWVYLAVAMYPFMFLLNNLSGGSGCIVDNAEIVNKMYFPRSYLAISHVLGNFIILVMGYILIIAIVLISGFSIPLECIACLPLLMGLMFVYSLGMVLLFSSLNVYVKDIRHLLAAVEVLFYFITPLFCVIHGGWVPESLEFVFWLNPFTYFVEFFHSLMYYGVFPSARIVLTCIGLAVVHIVIGAIVFSKLTDGFSERI